MGTCKYCGQSAGFFSRTHKECEDKHDRGLKGMGDLMRRYFAGTVTAADLKAKLAKIGSHIFFLKMILHRWQLPQ